MKRNKWKEIRTLVLESQVAMNIQTFENFGLMRTCMFYIHVCLYWVSSQMWPLCIITFNLISQPWLRNNSRCFPGPTYIYRWNFMNYAGDYICVFFSCVCDAVLTSALLRVFDFCYDHVLVLSGPYFFCL